MSSLAVLAAAAALLLYLACALLARSMAPAGAAMSASGIAGASIAQGLPATPGGTAGLSVSQWLLVAAWGLHGVAWLASAMGWGQSDGAQSGPRLGFAPVLSVTVWLMIAIHQLESRMLPMANVRVVLAVCGAAAVGLAAWFPGEVWQSQSALAPLHFVLGLGSYGLFAVAVLHALLLGRAERRMRPGAKPTGAVAAARHGPALPVLLLERLTFRFVQAGFVVLSATVVLGAVTTVQWRWSHKLVFSLLAWAVFAALLLGRHWRGWRGRQATRWLYAGSAFLLLAYVGSRFVFEVLLGRPAV